MERLEGLKSGEALRRLVRDGPNQLAATRTRGLLVIIIGALREPMFLFLLAATALYLALGDLGEGLFLMAGAIVSIGLVVAQEARSERALAALRRLAEPTARVVRDGVEQRIAARDLVRGDILLVAEGERIAADARLLTSDVLTVDESALTGESAAVHKTSSGGDPDNSEDPVPGGAGGPFLFAGSLNLSGQGLAEITRTGAFTRLGRIGEALAGLTQGPTPLQKTARRLVGWMSALAVVFCLAVVASYGLLRGDWVQGGLSGITLAISLLPEEFPMVLAVFMALGSWRLAQKRVIVRRSAVVETLGATSVLCVDKTGTLTENRMTVATLWADGRRQDLQTGASAEGQLKELAQFAALACDVRPTDPMDKALRAVSPPSSLTVRPLRTYPLRQDRLAFIQIWPDGGGVLAAAKGAPETIFRLCRLTSDDRDRAQAGVDELAAEGLRVLAIATARADGPFDNAPETADWRFEGLVGFLDPVRADVPAALREAHAAGIEVVMITGDFPVTALTIARRAGIDVGAGALTGAELAAMTPAALAEAVARVRVFARIQPEQKLAIVSALRANGQVVAMTGDGVNDAPALEAAHVGIAMGQRGTDVARESADIVLLDDRFGSIVDGVRLGRRIFANLRKALTFVVAVHVPIAGLALVPILLGLPPLLYPMHVVLLELVIDPMSSLAFEAEPSERNAMRQPPRPIGEGLFGGRQLATALVQGAVILAAVLGLYLGALALRAPAEQARGAAFLCLVLGNITLAFADSSEASTAVFDRGHRIFWLISGTVGALLTAVFLVPALARIFAVATPGPKLLLAAIAIALVAGGWLAIARRAAAAISAARRPTSP